MKCKREVLIRQAASTSYYAQHQPDQVREVCVGQTCAALKRLCTVTSLLIVAEWSLSSDTLLTLPSCRGTGGIESKLEPRWSRIQDHVHYWSSCVQ